MQEQSLILLNLLFIALFLAGYLLKRLGIPVIISFILVGFLAKLWIPEEEVHSLTLFKEAGIILLFFFIGMEYSFERLKGMVSIWKPGVIDLLLNFFPTFFISLAFGFDYITSLIIAGVVYPSSTSIVAKLLMEFKRLASPEAELLIGILIFEDLVAILLLSFLIPLKEAEGSGFVELPLSLVKILVIFVIFYLLDRYVIPKVSSLLDKVSEEDTFVFFLLGSILLTGLLFKEMGISEALGAFLLGVLVPETRIMENIEHHLSSLKEFSIGIFFFFFAYETQLEVPREIYLLVVITLLGIITKILSTYLAGWVFGLKRKSRLRAALSFVPRGEFSVIIASMEPSVKVISVPFIFTTAVLGSFLFGFSGKIVDKIYPPKKKRASRGRSQAQLF